MKKLTVAVAAALSLLAAQAQNTNAMKGNFEKIDCGRFALHVYTTEDALADASFIFEGDKGLIILEAPLFKENIAEFAAYTACLGKPVERVVMNYHIGGVSGYGDDTLVMIEGMPEFETGAVYGGMIEGFKKAFGESADLAPHGKVSTVPRCGKQTWAGIDFVFTDGASSDFPASSIAVGGKVYYTHYVPSKAHFTALQINGADAIDATVAALKAAEASGCTVFIGEHGIPAVTDLDTVRFQIEYLGRLKEARRNCGGAAACIEAMKRAYPLLPNEDGLEAVVKTLYER